VTIPAVNAAMTTLCIPHQGLFSGFDLLYSGVHAWCGQGVGKSEINNWIQTLETISRHTKDDDWTLYSGHGAQGKREILGNMKQYLQTFLKVTSAAASREEATGQMKKRSPGFAQEEFLLVQSINFHVRESPKCSTAPA